MENSIRRLKEASTQSADCYRVRWCLRSIHKITVWSTHGIKIAFLWENSSKSYDKKERSWKTASWAFYQAFLTQDINLQFFDLYTKKTVKEAFTFWCQVNVTAFSERKTKKENKQIEILVFAFIVLPLFLSIVMFGSKDESASNFDTDTKAAFTSQHSVENEFIL